MARSDQKKAAALAALMESSTLTEAAEKAAISRKTLYTYIREDFDFSQAYKSLREQAEIRAVEALDARRERASEIIMAIMEDEKQPAAIRLKAAQTIIEASAKQSEKVSGIAVSHVKANTPNIFDLGLH